jgi:hypothetical protein
MNREYFEESFGEWLDSRSRFRRWQRPIAAGLLAAGATVVIVAPSFTVTGMVLGMIAAVEALDFYRYRANWIRGRLSARGTDPIAVQVSFDEAGIHTTGPTST